VTDSLQARVLIVEDDPVVVETLRTYLEHAGFDVISTSDGADGLARAQASDIALVILDWMVAGMNGPEVCRRLRAVSTVPVLMLTARTAEDDRVRGLETGADDYVPKPFSPREVVARVQALLRRSPAAGGRATRPPTSVGGLEVDHFKREARVGGTLVVLTPTEFRLLEALATHPGRTFSREELVSRAFGPDYDGLDRTVDTHITNLRRKLHAGGGHSLIHTVHGVGYRLMVPE
jgi:two-component system alkaline phosphatase synthesis response regulator PhoP